jgi:membrane protein
MIRHLRAAAAGWVEDGATQMGAALAYYMLFSLTPLLIIAIGVVGLVYGESIAQDQIIEHVGRFIGTDGAEAVQSMLANFRRLPAGIWAYTVGVAALWFGALGVFTQLRASLQRIWRIEAHIEKFWLGLFRQYLLAFLMVLVTLVFILLLVTASSVLGAVIDLWGDLVPGKAWAVPVLDIAISSVLITLLFAFTYRFMSDGRVPYRHLWGGAFLSAVLFSIGKLGFGVYIGYTGLASAYGAAGSLVIFLVWVYYSAQIFFFGAEIIRVGIGK